MRTPPAVHPRATLSCLATVLCLAFAASSAEAALQAPKLVKDLLPGDVGSYPSWAVVHGDRLIFTATSSSGEQVFISDGTSAGTTALTSFTSAGSVTPSQLFAVAGRVCFDGPGGIYVTDGTVGGTKLVGPTLHRKFGVSSDRELVINNVAYFTGADDAKTGLWRTDGTAAGTKLVAETYGAALGLLGGKVYFTSASKLRATDGTAAGTSDVATLTSTSALGVGTLGSSLFFLLAETQLWKTDGTGAGTVKVADLPASGSVGRGDDRALVHDGKLFFSYTLENGRHVIWQTDGTAPGTKQVTSTYTRSMASFGGALFFAGSSASTGLEPMKVTTGAPALLEDLVPGSTSSAPSDFVVWGSRLAFMALTPVKSLYVTDGAAVTDLGDVSAGKQLAPTILGATPRTLFLRGFDAAHGAELWVAIDDSIPPPTAPPSTTNPGTGPEDEKESSGDGASNDEPLGGTADEEVASGAPSTTTTTSGCTQAPATRATAHASALFAAIVVAAGMAARRRRR